MCNFPEGPEVCFRSAAWALICSQRPLPEAPEIQLRTGNRFWLQKLTGPSGRLHSSRRFVRMLMVSSYTRITTMLSEHSPIPGAAPCQKSSVPQPPREFENHCSNWCCYFILWWLGVLGCPIIRMKKHIACVLLTHAFAIVYNDINVHLWFVHTAKCPFIKIMSFELQTQSGMG